MINHNCSTVGDDQTLPGSSTYRPGRSARHHYHACGSNHDFNRGAREPDTYLEGSARNAGHRVIPKVWDRIFMQQPYLAFILMSDSNRAGARTHMSSTPPAGWTVRYIEETPLAHMQICMPRSWAYFAFTDLQICGLSFLGGPRTCLGYGTYSGSGH
jgi:hypothetical protein